MSRETRSSTAVAVALATSLAAGDAGAVPFISDFSGHPEGNISGGQVNKLPVKVTSDSTFFAAFDYGSFNALGTTEVGKDVNVEPFGGAPLDFNILELAKTSAPGITVTFKVVTGAGDSFEKQFELVGEANSRIQVDVGADLGFGDSHLLVGWKAENADTVSLVSVFGDTTAGQSATPPSSSTSVSEPATGMLLGGGTLALAAWRRRRNGQEPMLNLS